MFVTFSGCDGAGKSTQILALMEAAKERKLTVTFVWSRGGYTPLFQFAKSLVLWILGKKKGKNASSFGAKYPYKNRRKRLLGNKFVSQIWLSLAIFDLLIFYCVYLRLLCLRYDLVLCDRYLEDTRIDFTNNFPDTFSKNRFGWRVLSLLCPDPDVKVVLTIPVSVSLKRSAQKNEPFPDNAQTLAFRLACYQNWPEFNSPKSIQIDGTKPLHEIFLLISQVVFFNK